MFEISTLYIGNACLAYLNVTPNIGNNCLPIRAITQNIGNYIIFFKIFNFNMN